MASKTVIATCLLIVVVVVARLANGDVIDEEIDRDNWRSSPADMLNIDEERTSVIGCDIDGMDCLCYTDTGTQVPNTICHPWK